MGNCLNGTPERITAEATIYIPPRVSISEVEYKKDSVLLPRTSSPPKKRQSICGCGAHGELFHTTLKCSEMRYGTHYYCKKCGHTWNYTESDTSPA
jgi:hypothetical protein